MNKLFTKIGTAIVGMAMAVGVGVAGGRNSVQEAKAADSGIAASSGTFVLDFYNSEKLTSTSGNEIGTSGDYDYKNYLKVDTGLTKSDVVTGITKGGDNHRVNMNGGLTLGKSSSNTDSITFSIGSDYVVNKVTLYAAKYDNGTFSLKKGTSATTADSGDYAAKQSPFSEFTKEENPVSPLVWDNLDGLTSLEFTKTANRMTIYTIVCNYSNAPTGTAASINGEAYVNSGSQWSTGGITEDGEGHAAVTGATYSFTPSTGATISSSDTSAGTFTATGHGSVTVSATKDGYKIGSKTVTIVNTIQEVITECKTLATATGTVSGNFTVEGTITGNYSTSSKNNYFIQQGDYAIYLYDVKAAYAVGDVIRVTGTFGKYNKWIESRSIISSERLEKDAESISPVVITDLETLTDDYQNRVVTFTGLTYDSGDYDNEADASINFKLGTKDLVLRTTVGIGDEEKIKAKLAEVKSKKETATFNLVGVHYTVFNDAKQFKVDNATKIQVVPNEATDKEIVQEFVNTCMHLTDIPVSAESKASSTDNCSKTGGYYEVAKAALTVLTEDQIALFKSDDDFNDAQERYESWAAIYGDTTPYSAEYTIANQGIIPVNNSAAGVTIIVIIGAIVGITIIVGLFYLRKKKEN